ncbi:hypothetical protein [Rhabdochromatium marinum]|uniref:hypothetical protein n=1 Tax=Rhabdochromatium marinum TaxID=48729 RepID=UPI0019061AEA|nr:hypothetical protein [Rhabdochromatium marinum]
MAKVETKRIVPAKKNAKPIVQDQTNRTAIVEYPITVFWNEPESLWYVLSFGVKARSDDMSSGATSMTLEIQPF